MNRRDFLKVGAAAAVSAPAIVRAEGAPRVFKVGIVGCGGRGNGALGDIHKAAELLRKEGCNVQIKVVAAADFFVEKAKKVAQRFGFDEKFAFGGACGYRQVMASDADIVILTTPLAFRPVHTMAAIQAGKHVFAEKGVAVDGPGVRLMIAASKLAREKGLTIVAGTQRRHSRAYRLIADALQKGIVSPIIGGNVYWNGAVPWVRPRAAGMSNAEYLCNNWLNFTELSGDHICEQHVHNIDIANWYIGRYPKSALGFGARMRRVSGNQYDFFSVDFDYGEGVHIHSMCRQIDGCSGGGVGEVFRTKDSVISAGHAVRMLGTNKRLELSGDFKDGSPTTIEHWDLLRSIMKTGPYFNEGEQVAMSTACAIIGRISCYTGQIVSMASIISDENSKYYNMECLPRATDFEKGEVSMPANGDNEWALPGRPWRGLEKGTPTTNKATQGAPLGYSV